jgi:hypothetical protein
MKHYCATVQCKFCGCRFSVCVHSARLIASGRGVTVLCPENRSKVHVPAAELVACESCPPGAVVVKDDSGRLR